MARSKKSRKEGALMKKLNLQRPEKVEKEPRKRKIAGNKAGSRQQVEKNTKKQQVSTGSKDARHGSKKAIPLGIDSNASTNRDKPIEKKEIPLAAVTVIEPVANVSDMTAIYEQELQQLEENEQLMLISAKLDAGEQVSDQDIETLEAAQQRYQELCELLGIEDEEFDTEISESDDDDILDRLDDTDFSEFKE
ncbi:Der GTPase-activating protein YihI [Thalassotalea ponticola]|uniref:Der GTPase-activating protein YihI n=1 Tax=Thalassotalea ponticola TaxID=1523392 RepID=UPI0025B4A223|nr:Der GTPase-activating protein YihI [Thalassotalea ponticola]MDN3652930.1 Der GTPase-activating protein YihI [Thalassotalea ponticola]